MEPKPGHPLTSFNRKEFIVWKLFFQIYEMAMNFFLVFIFISFYFILYRLFFINNDAVDRIHFVLCEELHHY